ncbi:MAG: 50S ribosomal protein L4 [Nitrospiraceae bacterium]|nr:MAG: 50S ribosomal protein L4 [Nitrospiraceae bacterium]
MPQAEIINKENNPVGKAELPEDIFGVTVNKALLFEAVHNHLSNKRQGTAATKTKGLVSGGGKKPWRQKGTGRARAGSNRSPLWRGGGTIFGPQPRDYSYKMPKKAKWLALNSALAAKLADNEVVIIDDLSITEPKTRAVKALLKKLGLGNVLIIVPGKDETLELAARNIPGVNVARVSELNVYSVLSHEKLLISKAAVERMREAYVE